MQGCSQRVQHATVTTTEVECKSAKDFGKKQGLAIQHFAARGGPAPAKYRTNVRSQKWRIETVSLTRKFVTTHWNGAPTIDGTRVTTRTSCLWVD
jgi:hypothetical protein